MHGLWVLFLCLLASQAFAETDQEDEKEEVEAESDVRGGYDNVQEEEESSPKRLLKHPCYDTVCGLGEECDLDADGLPVCICIRKCSESIIKVCSTQNVTFESECEFHRQHCLCQNHHQECERQKYKNAHLDYYGPCKEIPVCTDEQMEEFPHRMSNWLFLVMEELDSRKDLGEAAHNMVQQAKTQERPWVLPVIWKFCDLDQSHDRLVNSEELFPITAPLKPLEHCSGPFLEKCDANDDGVIDLEEWGICLGLEPEEIADRCEELRN